MSNDIAAAAAAKLDAELMMMDTESARRIRIARDYNENRPEFVEEITLCPLSMCSSHPMPCLKMCEACPCDLLDEAKMEQENTTDAISTISTALGYAGCNSPYQLSDVSQGQLSLTSIASTLKTLSDSIVNIEVAMGAHLYEPNADLLHIEDKPTMFMGEAAAQIAQGLTDLNKLLVEEVDD